jgi:hypothetical protein
VVGDAVTTERQGFWAAHHIPGFRPGRLPLAGDSLPERGRDLLAPGLDGPRIVAGQDERGDAVAQDERQEVIDSCRLRRDVQQAADLARIPAGRGGGLVDDGVAAFQVAGLEVGQAGQPAVGLLPGQAQHPRAEDAEPDGHVMGRLGAALGAADPVLLAVGEDAAPPAGVPGGPDEVDRLAQAGHRFGGRASRPAHRLDRIPEGARAEA